MSVTTMNIALSVEFDYEGNTLKISDPDGLFIFNYDFCFSDKEITNVPTKSNTLFFNFKSNRLLVFNYWGMLRSSQYSISNFYILNDLPCSNIFPKNLLNHHQFEEQFRSRYASYLLDSIINK